MLIKGIYEAVNYLYHNEDKRQLLANGAMQRAKDFSWEEKATRVNQIYRLKLGKVRLEGTERS